MQRCSSCGGPEKRPRPSVDAVRPPCFMLACNVFAAATDAEGRRLMTSMQLAFADLRTGHRAAA